MSGPAEIPVADGGSRLTHLMKACADLLDAAPDGHQLDSELRQLLYEVDDCRPQPRILDRFRSRGSRG
ncbi:hypothetical protein ACFWAP_03830 [Streptomyces goshikiensis]|uniref:hypothetical protein n=1 Tax=Streptomyces goshikiensis TaxID=1942 RepID=UPI00365FBFB1